MACDIGILERSGIRELTVEQMRAENILPPLKPGEPASLVQQIRQRNAEEASRLKRLGKRERRREQARLLAEARAKGELQ